MNVYQKNVPNSQEEFDISHLFITVWKHKIIVIFITLIVTIFAVLYSRITYIPTYTTEFNIIVDMPETYETKYGEYSLPDTMNQEYVNLITGNDILLKTIKDTGCDKKGVTVEGLKNNIEVVYENEILDSKKYEQILFDVQVTAGSAEDSQKLANALYDNYVKFMDTMMLNRMLSYFENHYTADLKLLEADLEKNNEILEYNEELLKTTPQTIDQKEISNVIVHQTNTSDIVVLENVINSNYTRLQNDIITAKQEINSLEYSVKVVNEYIEEIRNEKEALNKYIETGAPTAFEQSEIDVIASNIYLASETGTPSQSASPSTLKNVIIGVFLGGMLGVLIAFMKEYLYKKKI